MRGQREQRNELRTGNSTQISLINLREQSHDYCHGDAHLGGGTLLRSGYPATFGKQLVKGTRYVAKQLMESNR